MNEARDDAFAVRTTSSPVILRCAQNLCAGIVTDGEVDSSRPPQAVACLEGQRRRLLEGGQSNTVFCNLERNKLCKTSKHSSLQYELRATTHCPMEYLT